jgi:hypothetical protein
MVTNSSKFSTPRLLATVSASQAKQFLLELANLREDVASGKRFFVSHGRLCPMLGRYMQSLIAEDLDRGKDAKPEDEQIDEMLHEHWLLPLRDGVRSIWSAPDLRTKQWGVLRILNETSFAEDESASFLWPYWNNPGKVASLPPPTAFELVLRYLIRSNVHAYLCANRDCSTPYFIASRRGQKYCSDACALPAQREFKRRWWNENGNAWRRERNQKPIRRK